MRQIRSRILVVQPEVTYVRCVVTFVRTMRFLNYESLIARTTSLLVELLDYGTGSDVFLA